MRGKTDRQTSLLVLQPQDLIPTHHPIRRIKPIVDAVLRELSPLFDEMYDEGGRASVPPESLLKASVLMSLYSVRSERQFCERLRYDLLFKWFLDLNIADEGFDHSTFSKNRARLLEHEVAQRFFAAVVQQARLLKYLSDQHFTVDGTLLEAWASVKSFTPRQGDPPAKGAGGGGRNPEVDFHGEKRSNQTHQSTTDPEALLFRKGNSQPAKLYYAGHVLMENRNGLVVGLDLTQATGFAERATALDLLGRQPRSRQGRRTVGADKGYDTRDFSAGCRAVGITPHLARNTTKRRSSIDGRTTRHRGYAISQRVRKRVEEIFGWTKTVGGGRKLRYIGREKNKAWALLTAAAYNLVRISNLSLAGA
jgi:transposase